MEAYSAGRVPSFPHTRGGGDSSLFMSRKAVEIGKLEVNTVKILVEKFEESDETHQSLAEKVGFSRPAITKTFAGNRATTLSELDKIANALGLKLSAVVAEAECSLRKTPARREENG